MQRGPSRKKDAPKCDWLQIGFWAERYFGVRPLKWASLLTVPSGRWQFPIREDPVARLIGVCNLQFSMGRLLSGSQARQSLH